MRALIVKKEHLDKMFVDHPEYGVPKTWEMRSSKTKIRGKILLIESGSGHIVGETVIEDSLPALSFADARKFRNKHQVNDWNLLKKWCFPWVLRD